MTPITIQSNNPSHSLLPVQTRKPTYTKFVSDAIQIQNKLNKEYQFAQAEPTFYAKRLCLQYPLFDSAQETPLSIHTETTQIGPYTAQIASAQGRRPTMEDAHLAQLLTVSSQPIPLFGIFDGHGGPEASLFLKNQLPAYLEHFLAKFNPNGQFTDVGIWNALKHAFLELDADFQPGNDGSTANIALIIDNHLWIANVGDTRAILSLPNGPKQLSEDAKPELRRYRRSIEKRGGIITRGWDNAHRINHLLAVGRAFGNHKIRNAQNIPCLPHAPKITKTSLKDLPPNATLLIACDGIWDIATTPQVSAYLQQTDATAANLVAKAYNAGSSDNLSALLVKLR